MSADGMIRPCSRPGSDRSWEGPELRLNFEQPAETAPQIASASAASFFCRLKYGFTQAGGISRTLWSSALSSRDQ